MTPAWKWTRSMVNPVYIPHAMVLPTAKKYLMPNDANIYCKNSKTNPAHGQPASTPQSLLQFLSHFGIKRRAAWMFRSELLDSKYLKASVKARSSPSNVALADLGMTQYSYCPNWERPWQNSAWKKKTALAIGLKR